MPKKSVCAAAFLASLGIVGVLGAAQAGASPLPSSALPAGASATRTHTVQPGDSLSTLAQRYGTTVTALAATNGISNINVIDVGQVLTIPTGGATASPVRPVVSSQRSAHSGTSYGSPSGVWGCIASHESGGNPATDTGNGYYGMYQFTLGSWAAAGGHGNPAAASASEQTAVAQRLQARSGWGNWPVTSRECGA